jgi:hypothetical protein
VGLVLVPKPRLAQAPNAPAAQTNRIRQSKRQQAGTLWRASAGRGTGSEA